MTDGTIGKIWLVRYGEIALKSPPVRKTWEAKLISNIQMVLPRSDSRREHGRIWLSGEVDPAMLARVFGIVSFSPCWTCDLKELKDTLLQYIAESFSAKKATFGLRIRRIGHHQFTSQECATQLGSAVLQCYPDFSVNLTNPDILIMIEIRENRCYLFYQIFPGVGGIPLGVEGALVVLLSGGIDSAVAAWLMMKRGCRIIPVFIDMTPLLGESARDRIHAVLDVLRRYQPDIDFHIIEDRYVAQIQETLRTSHDKKYVCLLCKRRMYRLAEKVARNLGAKGIVTGESMGQVASQTLDNLAVLHEATTMPVYRPLIGLDKTEIIDLARRIGTYEPSILSSNCCGAVPQKPATKADPGKIRKLEDRLASVIGYDM
ncbi:MAG: tRNA 4-thiouridine(8) synthase ThiI [Methanomicrobiales archaeon]|nr:tRNA 4-thiouridine(8) synthase ThiI [Methanomicrobiales archaeon]